jgi:hypothetical protein
MASDNGFHRVRVESIVQFNDRCLTRWDQLTHDRSGVLSCAAAEGLRVVGSGWRA